MKSCFNIILLALLPFATSAVQPEGKRLIKISENEPALWKSEAEVFQLIKENINFFDITEHPNPVVYQPTSRIADDFPTSVNYRDQVKRASAFINKEGMSNFLEKYSSFYNRYYKSDYGAQASEFLLTKVKEAGHDYNGTFSADFFKHNWKQSSIVAKIEGHELKDEIIVIGAHLDSINASNSTGRAPGADDDGTGTTSVLEALRTIVKANLKFKRSIEFQFYSAEEVGLLGSQDIAQAYAKQNKKVAAMMQLDMTGWNTKNRIRIITDYTDPELTQFLRMIVENYSTYQWFDETCGYACSDHASYHRAGYKASRPAEDIKNFRLHTVNDTTQFVNYDHVAEYTRIALGFSVELAKPLN